MKMLSTCVIFAEIKELWMLVDIVQYHYPHCCMINAALYICMDLPALAAIIFANLLTAGKFSEKTKGEKGAHPHSLQTQKLNKNTLEQVNKSSFEAFEM